jgi:hypothetical protein
MCMLAGAILGVLVARPVLTHDEYVAALETGLLLKLEKEERFVLWNDVGDIRWDAAQAAVVIRMREGNPTVIAKPFGTAKGEEVAAKLDDVRRKAGFHLL